MSPPVFDRVLPRFRSQAPTGVGLGLRWDFIDQVEAGEAPANIAFYEVSPENYIGRGGYYTHALRSIRERHPLITHGLMMNLGSCEPLDSTYLQRLAEFTRELGTPHHSDHLCWTGCDGQILHDLLPLWRTPATVQRVADHIRRAQDALGLPMAIENISHYLPLDAQGAMPELDFICAILERADCGLMLDVNNVQVNADNHGFDAEGFIAGLPLERVVQMHVAGGEYRDSCDRLIIDSHGSSVDTRVEELMRGVVTAVGPVPVIYERDHEIPELTELGRQIGVLQTTYAAGLAAHEGSETTKVRPASAPERLEVGSAGESADAVDRDREAMRAFQRTILAIEDEGAQLAGSRQIVYRNLVRNGIQSVVQSFLERTRARLGPDHFDHDCARWLAECGPKSKYLRDLPHEFREWVEPLWRADPERRDDCIDLARHELVAFEAGAAPDRARNSEAGEIGLNSQLIFHPSARLVDYDHAVHELTDDLDDISPAPERACSLLVYRDEDHQIRYLELTALARRVSELALEGRALGECATQACADIELALDDESLARIASLLSDFVERGILVDHRALGVPEGSD